MMKRVLAIAASLVSLAGMLLLADAASAQAMKTPLEGAWQNCVTLEPPERDWVDEDGIRHVRDFKFRCRHTGDIVGREVGWESWDGKGPVGSQAGATGHGYLSFFGHVLGEERTAIGRFTFECSWIDDVRVCTEDHVWHL